MLVIPICFATHYSLRTGHRVQGAPRAPGRRPAGTSTNCCIINDHLFFYDARRAQPPPPLPPEHHPLHQPPVVLSRPRLRVHLARPEAGHGLAPIGPFLHSRRHRPQRRPLVPFATGLHSALGHPKHAVCAAPTGLLPAASVRVEILEHCRQRLCREVAAQPQWWRGGPALNSDGAGGVVGARGGERGG
eukprot:scaffold549_cov117-Isochrysis_galbana.AAC.17